MDKQEWDVWRCRGKSKRAEVWFEATPHREDDALKPDAAVGHWDTVWATTASQAVANRVR